jgi:hypothetical protein
MVGAAVNFSPKYSVLAEETANGMPRTKAGVY